MTPALLLLLDAPRPGAVLPGVAREAGELAAARLYRVLAARCVRAAEEVGWPLTIWFRPADARAELQQWLGTDRDLRPQASGPLGARVAAAASSVPFPSGWMAIVRPAPGLDRGVLARAAELLADAPMVLGPASDGGVYLVGGRVAPPAPCRDLAGAGAGALGALREGFVAAGVVALELPVLHVIETAGDAQRERLLP